MENRQQRVMQYSFLGSPVHSLAKEVEYGKVHMKPLASLFFSEIKSLH